MASSFLRFLDHTQRLTTVGTTPLNEWSARRRDLYLTAHNTHNRQTSMPPVGFEPTISARERPQIYALDRAATGTGNLLYITVCFLLGNSPTSEFYMPMFRNTLFHLHRLVGMKMEQTECSETLAYKNSDAGELPKRKHTTYRIWRKFEIKNTVY